jgi:hypothetical protein
MNDLISPGVNCWRNAVSDAGLLVDVELPTGGQNITFRRLCCLRECPIVVAGRATFFPKAIQWLTNFLSRSVE